MTNPISQISGGFLIPLPHISHLLGTEESQWPFGSIKQVGEQPSFERLLPSSQVSEPITNPSPHIGKQILGDEVQLYPNSVWQVLEQPSPSKGVPLMSSHYSEGDSGIPFPQTLEPVLHILGQPEQRKPDSTWQEDEHPSPEFTFWSSHCSEPS